MSNNLSPWQSPLPSAIPGGVALRTLPSESKEPLDALTRVAAQVLHVPMVMLLAIRPDRVWFPAAYGMPLEAEAGPRFDDYLPREGEPLLVRDVSLDPRLSSHAWVVGPPHIRMYAGVRLRSTLPQVSMALCVADRVPRSLTPEEVRLLVDLAQVMEGLLPQSEAPASLGDRLLQQTFSDVIHAIPNALSAREHLARALHRAHQNHATLGLLIVRLRDLTTQRLSVEEALFSQAMEILEGRLEALSDQIEMVRLNENELAVLCASLEAPSVARAMAWVALERIREPVLLHGQRMDFDAHIGIAVSTSDRTADELLAQARLAAAEAVRRDGTDIYAYDRALQVDLEERLQIAARLRGAAERGEMRLVYQPKICPYTHRVDSVEALLRWQSPDLGAVSPGRFIPLAEESGIIASLGGWILRQACLDAGRWRELGFNIHVAVNVSALQFNQPDFPEQVAVVLNDTGLPPEYLEIEITETAIISTNMRTRRTLQRLRRMGVRIALDDFGTGYSSLSQLRHLPIDTVKIDRSFVLEIHTSTEDATVFSSVTRMLHDLGMSIVVEGIEYPEQLPVVRRCGCELVQGWVYSRALPFDELCAFLRQPVSPSLRSNIS